MERRKTNRRGLDLEVGKRVCVYGILLLILASAQCSFFARLHILPATPDLILCALLAILVLDSTPAAAIAAVGGGILLDTLGGVGVSWSPLFYLALMVLMSLLASKMLQGFAAYFVLLLLSLPFRAGVVALGLWRSVTDFSFTAALREVILPEAIVTLVLGIPIYFLGKLCMLPFASTYRRGR